VATGFSTQLDQTIERQWFQNPIQALSPEIVRPFSWSQVPSRLALYEEDDMVPQQTAGASGVTMDFGSSYNVSTNINNEYNFDVQQNSTAFVFNYNNTNNTTQVSTTIDDSIYNAGDNITNNTTNTTGTSGFTGIIVSYSNMVWSDFENGDSASNFQLSFTVTNSTYVDGLLTDVSIDVEQEVVTFTALDTLYLWYLAGVTNEDYIHVRDVFIDGNLVEQYSTLYIDHGLVIDINDVGVLGIISPLTDCP